MALRTRRSRGFVVAFTFILLAQAATPDALRAQPAAPNGTFEWPAITDPTGNDLEVVEPGRVADATLEAGTVVDRGAQTLTVANGDGSSGRQPFSLEGGDASSHSTCDSPEM